MKKLILPLFALFLAACGGGESTDSEQQVVNVYSHRHYDVDQQIFDDFEKETGIKVNVVSAGADELIVRLQAEGENSPADLLVTSDASRLYRAYSEGLLQPASSPEIEKNVPAHLRDAEGHWTALTVRARVIVYHPDRVAVDSLGRIEDLANPQWKGRIVARSSSNEYNQSLMASIIAHNGDSVAEAWARGVVANFAREPKGNDRDQIKDIAAGSADLAFVNTYYLGKMMNSDNEAEREAAAAVKLLFPNKERGTHINVSGAGVTRHAPNKENAIKLLEYLTSPTIQTRFAEANYEYPANSKVAASRDLESLGELIPDTLPISKLGEYNRQAVEAFNRAGWN